MARNLCHASGRIGVAKVWHQCATARQTCVRPALPVSRTIGLGIIAIAACIASQAQTFTVLASFPAGSGLESSIITGSDGNFYGVTEAGGTNNTGTVFKATTTGTITTLHSFDAGVPTGAASPDGSFPMAALVQGSDGNFYGTTSSGGTSGYGTAFKISPSGTFTTLHSFGSTDGATPGALIQATDGNFYGMTASGGTGGGGTVFRMTSSGTLTTLSALSGAGALSATLVQGTDGNLYGIAGASFFRVTLAGALTMLSSSPPASICGPLIRGRDGNFYGFGTNGAAETVCGITPGGSVTALHSFDYADGFGGNALIQGADGNFYGTTLYGGNDYLDGNGDGTIFSVTPGGVFTTLYLFGSGGPALPRALTQGGNGVLYGVTNNGTFFSLTLAAPVQPAPSITRGGIVPVYSTSATIQPGEWVSIYGTNLASSSATWNGNFPTSLAGTSVTIDGKPAYLWFVSPTQINLHAPDDMATGTVPVVVTVNGVTVNSTVTLAQFAPSFSLLDSKHVTGIILRSNGTGAYGGGTYDILGPTGTSLGYATVAAKAGDSVVLFGVGFGPTTQTVPAGQVYSGATATTNPVKLLLNNASVTPSFAGLSSAGLYQINLTVPAGLGTGDVPLVAMVGGVQTQTGVAMSLQ